MTTNPRRDTHLAESMRRPLDPPEVKLAAAQRGPLLAMPFAIRNLSVLAYAQGFTLWHYKTSGALADIATPGFFDAAGDMLAAGDLVMASAPDGSTVVAVGATGKSVVVAPLSALPIA